MSWWSQLLLYSKPRFMLRQLGPSLLEANYNLILLSCTGADFMMLQQSQIIFFLMFDWHFHSVQVDCPMLRKGEGVVVVVFVACGSSRLTTDSIGPLFKIFPLTTLSQLCLLLRYFMNPWMDLKKTFCKCTFTANPKVDVI